MVRTEHSVSYSPIHIPQNLHINGREDILLVMVYMVNNDMFYNTTTSVDPEVI